MGRDVGDGEDGPVGEWSWVDPQAWETNAADGVTPAQRALITGPWVGPPVLGWVLVVTFLIIEGWAGWFGATTNGGFVPEGGWRGAAAMMAFIMVVVGWQLVAGIWFWGLPAWGDRYYYRKTIADLAACRVGSAVGQIEAGPDGPQAWAEAGPAARVGQVGGDPRASVGQGEVGERGPQALGEPKVIPVPFGTPALPPPGTYRLYWLERGKRGRLLLSARPLDE